MRAFTFLGVALLFTSAVASPAGQKKAAEGPRIEIVPEAHDFGNVRQNQKLVHEFTIQNTGTEDLVIGRISTSCGCTAALTSDRIIAPDASATLKVTLETRKYKGTIERSVSVSSNDARRVTTVRVKAFVEAQ